MLAKHKSGELAINFREQLLVADRRDPWSGGRGTQGGSSV